jgi:hypothetical protein
MKLTTEFPEKDTDKKEKLIILMISSVHSLCKIELNYFKKITRTQGIA